ncbi:MAG: radical SAM protein [Clostridia bacterium]|nr:radical SAM protein [Clostridia bacterium]
MLITTEHFKKIYRENKVSVTCLVLIINNECNANCKVCLAKQIFKSSLCKEICEGYTAKCVRCCDHTASDEEFYARLEDILSTINSPIVDIIITGGEPTLSNRFIPTLEILDKYSFPTKEIELETNGAGLGDKEIAKALIKHKVQIHLSRYGKSDDENQAEFGFTSHATTNADIERYAKTYGDLFGVSTVLLANHIESAEAMLDMMDAFSEMGVKHHAFLEVMADTTLRRANKEILNYYDKFRVPIEALSRNLELLGVKKIADEGNESYRFITHEYKGRVFTMTSSDLSKQHRQETNNGFSRFLIMPSGEIVVNGIEKR